MTRMNAVGFYKNLPASDPESLVDVTVSKPVAKGHDLLVQIKAISINPVDTKVRMTKRQVETMPKIPGYDAAGIVEAVGDAVTLFKPGDKVYYAGTLDRPGSCADYQLVEEKIAGHMPEQLGFSEAAALPLTTITAWEAMADRAGITPEKDANQGKSILIINAAGGVGSVATQLAKYFGLTVIGTASRPETATWAKAHGAEFTINHHHEFLPQLQTAGFADGVDYILCLHSTDLHWVNMAQTIKPQGHIVSIVENEHPLDLGLLKSKSVSFSWEFMFTRPVCQTPDRIRQHKLLEAAAQLVGQGVLRPTLNKQLKGINAATVRLAHQIVETNRMIGKLVIDV
ncbi:MULTISPECIES: zinc-binding alcohol dehydrogenase family protein [unclassified Sporolactobacillus]|uniref:zinc-binding alcohol dehydrogenase family protein n=1 Tax=unclassified Sporolactobacillus TaxID=2628533 RepID=UPI00236831B6|nr:zinc-binding alcohol dehydrogenase family protein [Sporolactobacillus sp. CQH2019]MDD9147787.1 zinc-binding alcohol dehydrogenase family protein [Sporolactobacillus sp. CQH2019]